MCAARPGLGLNGTAVHAMNDAGHDLTELVDVDDSLLVVIDVQDYFLDKYETARSQDVVGRIVWLLQVAAALDVPVVAMAEDIPSTGNLTMAVAEALPPGTGIYCKNAFGLADNPDIVAAIEATDRRTTVLVGMETDVCVAHSALGLLRQGYRVAVPRDAVLTTAAEQEVGLARMRDAGALITAVKPLYYEWLRTVEDARRLACEHPEIEAGLPASLSL